MPVAIMANATDPNGESTAVAGVVGRLAASVRVAAATTRGCLGAWGVGNDSALSDHFHPRWARRLTRQAGDLLEVDGAWSANSAR